MLTIGTHSVLNFLEFSNPWIGALILHCISSSQIKWRQKWNLFEIAGCIRRWSSKVLTDPVPSTAFQGLKTLRREVVQWSGSLRLTLFCHVAVERLVESFFRLGHVVVQLTVKSALGSDHVGGQFSVQFRCWFWLRFLHFSARFAPAPPFYIGHILFHCLFTACLRLLLNESKPQFRHVSRRSTTFIHCPHCTCFFGEFLVGINWFFPGFFVWLVGCFPLAVAFSISRSCRFVSASICLHFLIVFCASWYDWWFTILKSFKGINFV